jgi:3-oxoacyl-[acyl-carrier-protein] synthase-3
VLPSIASQVQTQLGITSAGCIDIYAACAGFTYGVILAKGLVAGGTHKKILVIGAETLSKACDMTDRTTCILFGDAAGAVLVEASEENSLFGALTHTDGAHGKDLYIAHQAAPINGELPEANRMIHQTGRVVFKWAVNSLIKKIAELAELNKISLDDLDWLIPHSANKRILEAVCEGLDFPVDKCLESIHDYGNTSSASIPLAWYNGVKSGKIKVGDKVLLAGFGGGLTYSGIYIHNQIPRAE